MLLIKVSQTFIIECINIYNVFHFCPHIILSSTIFISPQRCQRVLWLKIRKECYINRVAVALLWSYNKSTKIINGSFLVSFCMEMLAIFNSIRGIVFIISDHCNYACITLNYVLNKFSFLLQLFNRALKPYVIVQVLRISQIFIPRCSWSTKSKLPPKDAIDWKSGRIYYLFQQSRIGNTMQRYRKNTCFKIKTEYIKSERRSLSITELNEQKLFYTIVTFSFINMENGRTEPRDSILADFS